MISMFRTAKDAAEQRPDRLRRKQAWKRRLRLGKHSRASRFPTLRRQLEFSHQGLQRASQDESIVRTACLKPAPEDGHRLDDFRPS